MKHYLVYGVLDGHKNYFPCQAEDRDHAIEQAENYLESMTENSYIVEAVFVSDSPIYLFSEPVASEDDL